MNQPAAHGALTHAAYSRHGSDARLLYPACTTSIPPTLPSLARSLPRRARRDTNIFKHRHSYPYPSTSVRTWFGRGSSARLYRLITAWCAPATYKVNAISLAFYRYLPSSIKLARGVIPCGALDAWTTDMIPTPENIGTCQRPLHPTTRPRTRARSPQPAGSSSPLLPHQPTLLRTTVPISPKNSILRTLHAAPTTFIWTFDAR